MFEEIHKAVMEGLKNHCPLWMVSPDESAFRVFSRKELDGKSDQEIQEIFRSQHIIVYDQFEPTLKFDEEGLKTLGDLDRVVTIHGV
jgi:hypothetical protein